MGHYTGLRCKVKLKDDFVPVIEKMIETHGWRGLGYDFLDRFAEYSRASSIPFGFSSYLFNNDDSEEEWGLRIENSIWTFQCSLKDHDSTIQYFFINVLPKIAESSECIEVHSEYSDTPTILELHKGSVITVSYGD